MYGRNRYGTTRYGDNGTGKFWKALAGVVSVVASVGRKISKTISATVGTSADVDRATGKQIDAQADASVTVVRKTGKAISAIVDAVSTAGRKAGKTIPSIISAVPTINRKTAKAIDTIVNATATVVRTGGKIIAGGVEITATVGRVIKKIISATVGVSVVRSLTEILRPNGVGDETAIDSQFPATGAHWDKVNEAVADDASTTVLTATGIFERDLYTLPASSGSGTISKITVFFRYLSANTAATAKASIKFGVTVSDGAEKTVAVANIWETFSQEWTLNPDDGEAWEWADIDALQIGVSIIGGVVPVPGASHCTQVYVEVEYDEQEGIERTTKKEIAGIVDVSPTIGRAITRAISAVVDAVPTINRKTLKAIASIVDVTATVVRTGGKIVAGGVEITAIVGRVIHKTITATVSTVTSIPDRVITKAISAVVDVVPTVGRKTAKALSTVIGVTATVVLRYRKPIASVVNASVTMVRKTGKGILAVVDTPTTLGKAISKALDAAVDAVVTIGRKTGKAFSIVVDVTATVVRVGGKLLDGGVLVTATVGRVIKKTITATVNAVAKVSEFAYDMAWEMNKPIRTILGKVRITYTDPFFSAGIEETATETGRWTYPDQTTDNVTIEKYKWFSLHRNKLDKTFHLLPSNKEYSVGWWSTTLSDAVTAEFGVQPVLTITHGARSVSSLLVVGDNQLDEYPEEFTIRLYDAGDNVLHTEDVNAGGAVNWSKDIVQVDDVVKQTLTIEKWNRVSSVAKIAQFFTMIEEVYESEDGDLFNISVLEEMEYSQPTIPQGNISANTLTVRLNNIDDIFSAGNFNSRLYGFLLNNRAIEAWLGCDLHSGERIWFPLGTFYTRDWNAPENEAWAEVSGYDMLDRLKQTEFSTSEVYENITLYDLAIVVMADAGLTAADWDIDIALDHDDYKIPYAWFDRMSHREALRRIAAAALGQVYCGRDGKVVIEIYVAPASLNYDFNFDEANFFDIDHPLEWSQMINSVQARANPRVASALQDICVDDETFTVPAGETVTKTHFFDLSPCVDVADPVVYVNPEGNVTLGARTVYAWGMNQAYVNATGSDETVTKVTIQGKPLEVQGGRIVEAEDADSIGDNGRQTLSEPITSAFWQNEARAQAVADSLLASYKDPRRDVLMKARGNIALLLGDRVVAPDYKDEVIAGYALSRQDINFDGGMSVAVTGRRLTVGQQVKFKKTITATVDAEVSVGRVIKKTITATVDASAALIKRQENGLVGGYGARRYGEGLYGEED